MEQAAQVAQYFDSISADYRARYGIKKPFHNFFFRQRLNAAINGFAFNGKSVLDIGAGTGALYDELIRDFPSVDYFGCDISRQMLAHSKIPAHRAFVGRVQEIAYPRDRFDFIFSLGVTSYQNPEELAQTWEFIGERLAPSGAAVVSFTNRASIDYWLRDKMKIMKPFVGRGVLGQSFEIYAYTSEEVKDMARRVGLAVSHTTYLNQTFTPFNSLLPGPSVALARVIERRAPNAARLSADFIALVIRPEKGPSYLTNPAHAKNVGFHLAR